MQGVLDRLTCWPGVLECGANRFAQRLRHFVEPWLLREHFNLFLRHTSPIRQSDFKYSIKSRRCSSVSVNLNTRL